MMASKRARAAAVTVIFASFFTPTIWVTQPQTGTLLHGQNTRNRTRAKQLQKYVSYYRVSTQRQGRAGLGLEAQQAAVQGFLTGHPDVQVIAEFIEIESGKKSDR